MWIEYTCAETEKDERSKRHRILFFSLTINMLMGQRHSISMSSTGHHRSHLFQPHIHFAQAVKIKSTAAHPAMESYFRGQEQVLRCLREQACVTVSSTHITSWETCPALMRSQVLSPSPCHTVSEMVTRTSPPFYSTCTLSLVHELARPISFPMLCAI